MANPKGPKSPQPVVIRMDALDPKHDARAPDASVGSLVSHSRGLAETVRAQQAGLSKARVGEADALWLLAAADALQDAEDRWLEARRATPPGTMAAARKALVDDRTTLFLGLDAFVEDDNVARELDDIGGVDDDDDLAQDTRRLVKLCRTHAAALEGTEMDAAQLDAVEAHLAAFTEARRGVLPDPDGTTRQVLSEDARQAQARRNRVFWALAERSRRVCKRAQFVFRADEARRGLFTGYLTATRRRRANDPAVPVKPPVPQG